MNQKDVSMQTKLLKLTTSMTNIVGAIVTPAE